MQLIENVLPLNFFSNMAGAMVDTAILIELLKIYIPDLHQHLFSFELEMHLNNLVFRWFVSVFSNYLNEKVNSF